MSRKSLLVDRKQPDVEVMPHLKPGGFIPEPPPPGWDLPNATYVQRVNLGIAELSAYLAASIGRTITRREFVKRGGVAATIAGLGLGNLFRPEKALGYDPCGPNPAGCGPSEICASEKCNSSGNCKLSHPEIRRRAKPNDTWPGNYCASDTAWNYWYECCSSNEKKCADCCVAACGSCGSCSGCTSKKKCICRSRTGSC